MKKNTGDNPLILLGDYIKFIGKELNKILHGGKFDIGEYHYINDDNGEISHFFSIYSEKPISQEEQFSIISSLEDSGVLVQIDDRFEYAMEEENTYVYYIKITA